MLYIEDMCVPIPQFLKDNNFIVPRVCLYKNKHLEIAFEKYKISPEFALYVNTEKSNRDRVMWYFQDHSIAYHYYPEYKLSYGHVIMTGLGMNLLPNWIATKQEVTKITVIENNKYLIDYVKEYGFIDNKIKIICGNAEDYMGKCDVLLHDHNFGKMYNYIHKIDMSKIINNIRCRVFWNQRILSFANNNYNNYIIIKKNIPKLPNLTEEEFNKFVDVIK